MDNVLNILNRTKTDSPSGIRKSPGGSSIFDFMASRRSVLGAIGSMCGPTAATAFGQPTDDACRGSILIPDSNLKRKVLEGTISPEDMAYTEGKRADVVKHTYWWKYTQETRWVFDDVKTEGNTCEVPHSNGMYRQGKFFMPAPQWFLVQNVWVTYFGSAKGYDAFKGGHLTMWMGQKWYHRCPLSICSVRADSAGGVDFSNPAIAVGGVAFRTDENPFMWDWGTDSKYPMTRYVSITESPYGFTPDHFPATGDYALINLTGLLNRGVC